jgi:hypothetical protein
MLQHQWVIGARRAAARPDADAAAAELRMAGDAGGFQRDAVEGRVVHREDRADVAEAVALGPVALAVPGLQRDAHRRHAEFHLAPLHQDDVLVGPLGGAIGDLHAGRFLRDLAPGGTVQRISAARRGGAHVQGTRPGRVARLRGGGPQPEQHRRGQAAAEDHPTTHLFSSLGSCFETGS